MERGHRRLHEIVGKGGKEKKRKEGEKNRYR